VKRLVQAIPSPAPLERKKRKQKKQDVEEKKKKNQRTNLGLDVAAVDVIGEEAGAGQPLPGPTAGHSHEADYHHQHRPCLSKVCDGHSWQNGPVGCFAATQLHMGIEFVCQQRCKVAGDTDHVY